MFETGLEEALGDPSALLRLAGDAVVSERQAGCRKLVIAAAWADCHGAPVDLELADDAAIEAQSALVDRFVRIGPTGTPLVAECSPAELGNAVQTGPAAARNLMRVALIVRYRLPRLWERVKAGEVWLWKVRQIAERSAAGLGQSPDRGSTPADPLGQARLSRPGQAATGPVRPGRQDEDRRQVPGFR